MPIFRVKSVKIYTGKKNLHGYTRGIRDKYEVWYASFPSPPPPSLGYTRSTSVCVVDMPLALRAVHVMMFANEFKKLVSMPIYFASCKLCKHAFGIICATTKSASLYVHHNKGKLRKLCSQRSIGEYHKLETKTLDDL